MESHAGANMDRDMANKQYTCVYHAHQFATAIHKILHDVQVAHRSTLGSHTKTELDHNLTALCGFLKYASELTTALSASHHGAPQLKTAWADSADEAGGGSKDILDESRQQCASLKQAVTKAQKLAISVKEDCANYHAHGEENEGRSLRSKKTETILSSLLGLLQYLLPTSKRIADLVETMYANMPVADTNPRRTMRTKKTAEKPEIRDIAPTMSNLDAPDLLDSLRRYMHTAIADEFPALSPAKLGSHTTYSIQSDSSNSQTALDMGTFSSRSASPQVRSSLLLPSTSGAVPSRHASLLRATPVTEGSCDLAEFSGRNRVTRDDNVRDMRGHTFSDSERTFLSKKTVADLKVFFESRVGGRSVKTRGKESDATTLSDATESSGTLGSVAEHGAEFRVGLSPSGGSSSSSNTGKGAQMDSTKRGGVGPGRGEPLAARPSLTSLQRHGLCGILGPQTPDRRSVQYGGTASRGSIHGGDGKIFRSGSEKRLRSDIGGGSDAHKRGFLSRFGDDRRISKGTDYCRDRVSAAAISAGQRGSSLGATGLRSAGSTQRARLERDMLSGTKVMGSYIGSGLGRGVLSGMVDLSGHGYDSKRGSNTWVRDDIRHEVRETVGESSRSRWKLEPAGSRASSLGRGYSEAMLRDNRTSAVDGRVSSSERGLAARLGDLSAIRHAAAGRDTREVMNRGTERPGEGRTKLLGRDLTGNQERLADGRGIVGSLERVPRGKSAPREGLGSRTRVGEAFGSGVSSFGYQGATGGDPRKPMMGSVDSDDRIRSQTEEAQGRVGLGTLDSVRRYAGSPGSDRISMGFLEAESRMIAFGEDCRDGTSMRDHFPERNLTQQSRLGGEGLVGACGEGDASGGLGDLGACRYSVSAIDNTMDSFGWSGKRGDGRSDAAGGVAGLSDNMPQSSPSGAAQPSGRLQRTEYDSCGNSSYQQSGAFRSTAEVANGARHGSFSVDGSGSAAGRQVVTSCRGVEVGGGGIGGGNGRDGSYPAISNLANGTRQLADGGNVGRGSLCEEARNVELGGNCIREGNAAVQGHSNLATGNRQVGSLAGDVGRVGGGFVGSDPPRIDMRGNGIGAGHGENGSYPGLSGLANGSSLGGDVGFYGGDVVDSDPRGVDLGGYGIGACNGHGGSYPGLSGLATGNLRAAFPAGDGSIGGGNLSSDAQGVDLGGNGSGAGNLRNGSYPGRTDPVTGNVRAGFPANDVASIGGLQGSDPRGADSGRYGIGADIHPGSYRGLSDLANGSRHAGSFAGDVASVGGNLRGRASRSVSLEDSFDMERCSFEGFGATGVRRQISGGDSIDGGSVGVLAGGRGPGGDIGGHHRSSSRGERHGSGEHGPAGHGAESTVGIRRTVPRSPSWAELVSGDSFGGGRAGDARTVGRSSAEWSRSSAEEGVLTRTLHEHIRIADSAHTSARNSPSGSLYGASGLVIDTNPLGEVEVGAGRRRTPSQHVTSSIQDKMSMLESAVALAYEKNREMAKGDGLPLFVGECKPDGVTRREPTPMNKEMLLKLLSPVGQKAALAAVADEEKKKKEEEKKKQEEEKEKEKAPAEKGKGKGKGPPPPKGKGKGKGKGAGPPPPKGKGKGKKGKNADAKEEKVEEKIRKPELTPGVTMRPLFWNSFRIPEKTGEKSVWLDLDQEVADFNAEELERHFGIVPASKKFASAGTTNVGGPTRQLRVFEEGRRRQILVMLRRLPHHFFPAILHMDDSVLTADQVALLLDNLPQQDELTLIARTRATMLEENAGDEHHEFEWETAESFIIELSSMPQFSLRLRLWNFLLMFEERYTFFATAHENIREACKLVRNDPALHNLLRYALFVGNYLNAGTHRGRADGFNVEILTQMKNVKSVEKNKGVQTLIDFLVLECSRTSPTLISTLFTPNTGVLDMVSRASRFKLQDLQVELGSVIGSASTLLKQTKMHNLHDRDALRARSESLEKKCEQLQELRTSMTGTDSLFLELKKYYEVDFEKTTEEFFSIWESFLKDVHKSFLACEARNASNKASSKRTLRRNNTIGQGRNTVSSAASEESNNVVPRKSKTSVNGFRRCASVPMTRRMATQSFDKVDTSEEQSHPVLASPGTSQSPGSHPSPGSDGTELISPGLTPHGFTGVGNARLLPASPGSNAHSQASPGPAAPVPASPPVQAHSVPASPAQDSNLLLVSPAHVQAHSVPSSPTQLAQSVPSSPPLQAHSVHSSPVQAHSVPATPSGKVAGGPLSTSPNGQAGTLSDASLQPT